MEEKGVYTVPRNYEQSEVIAQGTAPVPVPPPHAAPGSLGMGSVLEKRV